MLGTVALLWHLFFPVEHKRAGGAVTKLGIWFLMISFGASVGYTIIDGASLVISRVQFLLSDRLRLPKQGVQVGGVAARRSSSWPVLDAEFRPGGTPRTILDSPEAAAAARENSRPVGTFENPR